MAYNRKKLFHITLWVVFVGVCGAIIGSKTAYWNPWHLVYGVLIGSILGLVIGMYFVKKSPTQ